MTTLTEPFAVASATTQGDGSDVFKVSAGQTNMGGNVFAASSISLVTDTTAAAVAGAGAGAGAVPASAAFGKITVNGTEYKIALYS